MVKKLKSKRKKFFAGGYAMPSAQKPFSGFTLTMDQLPPIGKSVSKGFIRTNKKVT